MDKSAFKNSLPRSGASGAAQGFNLPLSFARQGESVTIGSVRGKDDTKSFLASLGFVEGARVTVVSELGGNLIVNIKDSRVAISKAMAARILTKAI